MGNPLPIRNRARILQTCKGTSRYSISNGGEWVWDDRKAVPKIPWRAGSGIYNEVERTVAFRDLWLSYNHPAIPGWLYGWCIGRAALWTEVGRLCMGWGWRRGGDRRGSEVTKWTILVMYDVCDRDLGADLPVWWSMFLDRLNQINRGVKTHALSQLYSHHRHEVKWSNLLFGNDSQAPS